MRMAETIALRGTCDRLQVGALVCQNGRVISTGYNGNVAGKAHCNHRGVGSDLSNVPCTTAVHAETNALIFAARHGVAVEGADLWTTHEPCLACANLVINAGIYRVFFKMPYRLHDGLAAMQDYGIAIYKLGADYSVIQVS